MNAGIGYAMEYKPQSQMMMQPTETDISIWLETKMKPMIQSSRYLQKVVAKPRSREGVNNNKMISYPGGYLMFAWAGSPNTIHGRSAPKINADEVDRYEILKGQGHPVGLLEQRAATFGDDILVAISSTPTLKDISYVAKSFEAGDQRHWHVPCHECGYMQSYKWEQVIWDKGEDGEILPKTARYMCENCGAEWSDRDKIKANKKGEWRGKSLLMGMLLIICPNWHPILEHGNKLYVPIWKKKRQEIYRHFGMCLWGCPLRIRRARWSLII